jgi:tRNA(Leu) C34 or U34 (ribose-2'-O)-methylase TrmL
MTTRWRPEIPSVRGFSVVALDNPKNPLNVGSAMRAAHCYGAALLAVSGKRLKNWHATDTGKAWRHLPMLWTDDLRTALPHDCVPVAVELVSRAVPLTAYKHPERAFYIFGQEDGTLGDRTLSWCRDVVYIPTANCMNLAACVNVVLYDRLLKGERSS